MALVRYILEVERGGRSVRAFALPLVSRYTHNLDASSRLRWTLGRTPIEERSGVRSQSIRLAGNSGLQPRRGTSRSGSPMFGSGPALFKELEAFIREFNDEAARFDGLAAGEGANASAMTVLGKNSASENQSLVSEPRRFRMIFRAIDEGHDLYVQLGEFSFERSVASDNFTYSWSLSLTAYAVASPRQAVPVLGSITRAYAAIDRAFNTLALGVSTVDGYLGQADQVRRRFTSPLRAVSKLATTARSLAASQQLATAWPRDLLVDALNVSSEATVAVFESWAALPLTDRLESRKAMSEAVTAIADIRNRAAEAVGAAFIRTGTSDSAYSRRLSATQGSLVASYDVQPGDTLASIAGKVTGDRGRADEIAALNGIADPSNGRDGEPLRPGVSLLVPVSTGSDAVAVDPASLFGTDFAIGPDGDFVLEDTAATGAALVSGIDNLAQGLTHRLESRQGDSPLNSSWGLPFGPGDPITAESDALAVSRLRGQVLADRRVSSVEEVSIVTVGDARTGRCKAITVGGGTVRLTAPLAAGA